VEAPHRLVRERRIARHDARQVLVRVSPQPDGATEFIAMLDQLTPEYARYGAAL
jgi:hypothetical protein